MWLFYFCNGIGYRAMHAGMRHDPHAGGAQRVEFVFNQRPKTFVHADHGHARVARLLQALEEQRSIGVFAHHEQVAGEVQVVPNLHHIHIAQATLTATSSGVTRLAALNVSLASWTRPRAYSASAIRLRSAPVFRGATWMRRSRMRCASWRRPR